MERKKRILYVCQTDPRETAYGGMQRTHVIWKGLKSIENCDVWTIIPVPHRKFESQDEKDNIQWICFDKRYSIGWLFQRILRRIIPEISIPLGVSCNRLKKLDAPQFDVVISRYINPAAYLRLWTIAPLVIDVDDIPTETATFDNVGLMRRLFTHAKYYLLKEWQEKSCKHAKCLWLPDPRQGAAFHMIDIACLPNIPLTLGATALRMRRTNNRLRRTFGFVGYLAHQPNHQSLDSFITTRWNIIKKHYPEAKYKIAGGGLPDAFKNEWVKYDGIELLGYVDNLDEFYESVDAILMPMENGSGTCIKTLEALSHSMPVISTPQGLRGISKEHWTVMNGILPFATVDELLRIISELPGCLHDDELMSNSRKLIENEYSQKKVNGVITETLKRIWDDIKRM